TTRSSCQSCISAKVNGPTPRSTGSPAAAAASIRCSSGVSSAPRLQLGHSPVPPFMSISRAFSKNFEEPDATLLRLECATSRHGLPRNVMPADRPLDQYRHDATLPQDPAQATAYF